MLATPFPTHYSQQICNSIYQISQHLRSSHELNQAQVALTLYCRIIWIIIQGKLKDAKVELSEYTRLEMFDKWRQATSLLIQTIDELEGTTEVEKTIKDWTGNWVQHFSDEQARPISMVEEWVKIQIKSQTAEHMKDGADFLLGTLFQSSSKELSNKILQQEFLFYMQMQGQDPTFCMTMQSLIKGLLKDGSISATDWFEEAKVIRLCGAEGSKYCTVYLSEAIKDLEGNHLAVAYFLRSLCVEEYELDKQKIFEDIGSALAVMSTSDSSFSCVNLMKMLYMIIDLLSLKGNVSFHSTIYNLMFSIYTSGGVSVTDLMAKLWEFRRTTHALCHSPIHEAFTSLPDGFGNQLKVFEFWIKCITKSPQLVVGFRNKFSSPQYERTIEEASTLISSGSESGCYQAAFLYYDMCEILVSNGRSLEALQFGMEAYRIREVLFREKFPWTFRDAKEGYSRNHVEICRSVANEVWSFGRDSCDLDISYISPWNVLQCYLESILQAGVTHDLLGNVAEAGYFLNLGKTLSSLHCLTVFNIVFTSYLGEVHHKQQHWGLAKEELHRAKNLLKNDIKDCCSKCRLMLEVTVELNIADLCRNDASTAEERPCHIYNKAVDKLNTSEWTNSITFPREDGGKVECSFSSCVKKEASWDLDLENSVVSFGDRDATCICQTIGCWHCHTRTVSESNSMIASIEVKWELARRRLLLKLLTGLGKCMEHDARVNDAFDILLQCIAVLVGPIPFGYASISTLLPDTFGVQISDEQQHIFVYHLLGKEIAEDVFSVERAIIIYNLCWLSLKERNNTRDPHVLMDIPITKLVSWLTLAFVLSREVPVLFQKVSRLLAAIFSLSTSNLLESSLSTSSEDVYERHWVCYFHQASLGNQFNYLFYTKDLKQYADTQGSYIISGAQSLPSTAPKSVLELTDFLKKFYKDLPRTPVICLSILGSSYTSIFQGLLSQSSASAWILVSRLDLQNLPIHVLRPVHPGGDLDGVCGSRDMTVDVIAPNFRLILKELRNELLELPDNPTDRNNHFRSLTEKRTILDNRLCELLRDLENSCFGKTWKFTLLGEVSNNKFLDTICENLEMKLKKEFSDVDSSLVKVLLHCASKCDSKIDISLVLLESDRSRGCFFGDDCFENQCPPRFVSIVNDAVKRFKTLRSTTPKPIILVLDFEIQMIPWESLPILRDQEVYRMPSVWSVSRSSRNERKINPLNAFYLLNPGDDIEYKPEILQLFEDNKLKGTIGSAPAVEELISNLKKYDLFIYIGHGSGAKYIPYDRIESLNNCAGAVLAGCSSGSLQLNGCYVPRGPPISYLRADAPVVFCNLWDVLAGDMLRYTYEILRSWLREKSSDRRVTIGRCLSQCRNKCRFYPYLVGAALVIYGVPTELK